MSRKFEASIRLRSNLSIRMQNRRFTRLTNALSKKFTSHVHALGLYFAFYNFCRIHKTLLSSLRWPLATLTSSGRWKISWR